MSLLALVGSGEYLPVMNDVDRHLLKQSSANGRPPRVVCLPTAAGQEGETSYGQWMQMGEAHFRALDTDVTALPVIDRATADAPQYASVIAEADLIYFSGGDPGYLFRVLSGSKTWDAITAARTRGAVLAGCSAGAMILGESMPDIGSFIGRKLKGFGLLPGGMILPHFDQIPAVFRPMIALFRKSLKGNNYLVGVEEDTALVGKPGETWTVMGRQRVHLITEKAERIYRAGESVSLPQ